MNYLLRNIVKACELLSMSPFRRAPHLPEVGAEGWALPPLPHQNTRPIQLGTVHHVLPGDTEMLQTCCTCAHTHPLPVAWERRCSHLGWLGNQHQEGWAHYGGSNFFPGTLSSKERGLSLALDGCVASHDEGKGPRKKWPLWAGCNTGIAHPGC